jgi:hypothetical protein
MQSLIKKLLRESLDFKTLGLVKTNDYLILMDMNTEAIMGIIAYEKVANGLFHIPAIASEKGYGFMLFNIVMSIVSPDYIITDRDSSTTQAAVNVLNRMTQDPNIEHIVLDSEDPNYFPFKKESDEYNRLVNTKFKIKNPMNLTTLFNNGKAIRQKIEMGDDELTDMAFDFFSKKLNNS